MTFKPRHLTPALIFLALIFPVLSCEPSGTRTDGRRTLLVYTPHGQDMLNDFIARYTQTPEAADVDVRFMDMGSQEVLRRVTVELNRPQADLGWGAAHSTFQKALDDNLLAPYRPTWGYRLPAESRNAQDRW